MEISRMGRKFTQQIRAVDQALRDQVPNAALRLPDTINTKQLRAHEFATLLLNQALPDDDVDCSELVLKRQENHTAGGFWPLAHGDDPTAAG